MVATKKIIYVKAFSGEPKNENFRLETEVLPDLNDGEILCEALYLSIDPYMRPYMTLYPLGSIMIGLQVAKIIQSKNTDYPVGSHVVASFGWRTHTVAKPSTDTGHVTQSSNATPICTKITLLPDFGNLPLSLAIGYLGIIGATAYFGLLEICNPKAGETVVITGAAGAVGSLVGQIAKIKGCTVIGFAGSDEKCNNLKNELGFDYAFNYKTNNPSKCLDEAAPNGVDCYFDNVGGELSSTIINKLRYRGRVAACGSISEYNNVEYGKAKATTFLPHVILNEIVIEGFVVFRWADRYDESTKAIMQWIKDGKVKCKETITKGFENMPQALMDLLKGKNMGKAIVQI